MGQAKDAIWLKINAKLDSLQLMMEAQIHLSNPEKVVDVCNGLSLYWSVMGDEEKEYIDCCRYALEEKLEWNTQ